MERNFLEFGLPAWWILPAILGAAALAYLLYRKENVPWNQNKNILLGTLRFLAVLLILLLFLNPILQQFDDTIERPVVVLGVDNSSSIASIHDESDQEKIRQLVDDLSDDLADEKDYRIEVRSLSGEQIDSLNFDEPKTNLSGFFRRMSTEFSGQNLASMVIFSDGIYNRGSSPEYRSFNFPVITVGLGDSIPQKDIAISRVRSNEVAYSGNEFPVEVEISRVGFSDESVELEVRNSGNLLEKITLEPGINRHVFFLNADAEGAKRYVLRVSEKDGEVTYENNRHDLFIEILESKKQVLISGISPHPDMKAIRSALEETGNYDISLQIAGMNALSEERDFDVQIVFDGQQRVPGVAGYWIINSSPTGAHLQQTPFVSVQTRGQTDKVTPSLNSDFTSFKLNREIGRLKGYSPISVPFGEYTLSGPYEVLFYQKIGSVVTDKPLLAVVDDGTKRLAISLGQGIWQWRLQETARYGDHQLFTEFIQKLVQYLSINESKKQFRVTKGLETFTENEVVFFDVEIYDDIFQYVEGQPYTITITDEEKDSRSFEYVFGAGNKVAETNILSPGTYSFTATTTLAGKTMQETGQFVVNALQLEQRNLTADHRVLRSISQKSGGQFFHLNQEALFRDYMNSTSYTGIIHADTRRSPIIDFFWGFVIIACLLGAEWILRKAWGGY